MGRDPAKSQVLFKMQLPDCHPELVFSERPCSEPKQARGIRTLGNVSQKAMKNNSQLLLEITNCSYSPFPKQYPKTSEDFLRVVSAHSKV